jgi:hypothetical protein
VVMTDVVRKEGSSFGSPLMLVLGIAGAALFFERALLDG